jgi:manganese/iron transport system substrate-binding protein
MKTFRIILVWTLLGAVLAPADSFAAKKRIVTTFTIIQDMAQNVAGDAAIVESITKPGAEIHSEGTKSRPRAVERLEP